MSEMNWSLRDGLRVQNSLMTSATVAEAATVTAQGRRSPMKCSTVTVRVGVRTASWLGDGKMGSEGVGETQGDIAGDGWLRGVGWVDDGASAVRSPE